MRIYRIEGTFFKGSFMGHIGIEGGVVYGVPSTIVRLQKMLGWSEQRVRDHCKRKRWKMEEVLPPGTKLWLYVDQGEIRSVRD